MKSAVCALFFPMMSAIAILSGKYVGCSTSLQLMIFHFFYILYLMVFILVLQEVIREMALACFNYSLRITHSELPGNCSIRRKDQYVLHYYYHLRSEISLVSGCKGNITPKEVDLFRQQVLLDIQWQRSASKLCWKWA